VHYDILARAIWALPLYELALLAADELRERGSTAAVRIVMPEERAALALRRPGASGPSRRRLTSSASSS
jgi:hypothetical protein